VLQVFCTRERKERDEVITREDTGFLRKEIDMEGIVTETANLLGKDFYREKGEGVVTRS